MKRKRISFLCLCLILIFFINISKVYAEEKKISEMLGEPTLLEENNTSVVMSSNESTSTSTIENDQKNHTKEEITQKYLDAKTTVTLLTIFDQSPNINGPDYKEGTLSTLGKSEVLKKLNFFRYLAGASDVEIFEDYMSNNGKGAVLLSASDFSHTPTQPSDMSDEFYASAIYGTRYPLNTGYSVSGNISAGDFITDSIKGFIDDTANVVANSVGHRLSLLNPKAVGTSFGFSKGDSTSKTSGFYDKYTTMTMYSKSSSSTGKYYTWPPAGYCPVEVTAKNELWSISLDSNFSVSYSGSYVKSDTMTITLSCDGKTYTIDSNIFYSKSYNTIYFALPDDLETEIIGGSQYLPEKKVTVNITGGITNTTTSQDVSINYSIEFFAAEPIPITGIRVFGRDIELTEGYYWSFKTATGYVGGGKDLIISYEPSNTTEKELEVSFSNPDIASYNSLTDTINYNSAGTTTCTIKSTSNSDVSYTMTFTIYNKIESIHLEKYWYTIKKGEQAKANVVYSPSDNIKESDKGVTYEIADENIATVDENGIITAKNAGTTTITIKNDAGLESTSNIRVIIPVETISFDKDVYEGMLGEQISCNVIITPDDATYKDDYMYSYNEDELICYRNVNTIKGLKAGEFTVKATVEAKTATAKVRIYEPMTSFDLKESSAEIYINQKYSPTLENILPSGDYTKSEYILETSDSNIAKIENNKVVGVNPGSAIIKVTSKYDSSLYKTFEIIVNEEEPYANIEYTTHVQNVGWQEFVSDGQMAGTAGLSLRLEGIKIKIDTNLEGNIEYSTHIENIGWQDYVKNGEMSGTSGRGLRLEAIKIKLTDELAENYDIYYRVHAQNVGWLGWAKNGEESGTAGYGYRLEGIEIKLVEKDSEAPGDTSNSFVIKAPTVEYTTHVQNIGWQDYVSNGIMAGTSGKGLRLEGIKIRLANACVKGDIEYSTHIENIGWQDYVSNGDMSGTSGKGLRLEAIKIKLTDELEENFDVYYRVHAENVGWLGWAKNDEPSGTAGYGFRLEGIEIKIVEKGAEAPGSTNNAFIEK